MRWYACSCWRISNMYVSLARIFGMWINLWMPHSSCPQHITIVSNVIYIPIPFRPLSFSHARSLCRALSISLAGFSAFLCFYAFKWYETGRRKEKLGWKNLREREEHNTKARARAKTAAASTTQKFIFNVIRMTWTISRILSFYFDHLQSHCIAQRHIFIA